MSHCPAAKKCSGSFVKHRILLLRFTEAQLHQHLHKVKKSMLCVFFLSSSTILANDWTEELISSRPKSETPPPKKETPSRKQLRSAYEQLDGKHIT